MRNPFSQQLPLQSCCVSNLYQLLDGMCALGEQGESLTHQCGQCGRYWIAQWDAEADRVVFLPGMVAPPASPTLPPTLATWETCPGPLDSTHCGVCASQPVCKNPRKSQ